MKPIVRNVVLIVTCQLLFIIHMFMQDQSGNGESSIASMIDNYLLFEQN